MSNRKIIFQVTAAYMRKNRKRTLITFAGILVMVVLMTAVFIGKDTALDYMQRTVAAEKGSWHAQVYDVTKKQAEEIRALDSVAEAEISKQLGYSDFPESGNPGSSPFLELKGYSGDLFDWMNIRVTEGRLPENDRELLLSARALSEGADVRVGDTIKIDAFVRKMHVFWTERDEEAQAEGKDPGGIFFASGFRMAHGETAEVPAHFPYYASNEDFEMIHEPTGLTGEFTIVGIMEQPYYEHGGQGGYMALTRIDGAIGEDETVNLVLKANLASREKLNGAVAEILDRDRTDEEREEILENGMRTILSDGRTVPIEPGRIVINDLLLTLSAKGSDNAFNTAFLFFQAFFVVLITAASLVLIYNVFAISYRERCRYLGMLSSVGATRAQKRWSVYFEVFSLLLFALPAGILLGILLVKGGMALLYPHFSKIMGIIASEYLDGQSSTEGVRVIVRPGNVAFVLFFSAAAVWLSAWLPAKKIGRIGPVESIRGNDETTGRAKICRTKFGLLEKGRAEVLLASAGIGRNRASTRGIVRSLTAFAVLTLVTAFASRSLTDVVGSKLSDGDMQPGAAFQAYDYLFYDSDGAEYEAAKADVMASGETAGWREFHYAHSAGYIPLTDCSEEYRTGLETVIGKYYPDGIPEQIADLYTDPKDGISNPTVHRLILAAADFEKVARRAGADMKTVGAQDRLPVLFLSPVTLTTDDFRFAFDGAVTPDYTVCEIRKPLAAEPGEDIDMLNIRYDPETESSEEIVTSLAFAGYARPEDVAEFVSIRPDSLWMILSEDTAGKLADLTPDVHNGFEERYLFFSVNTKDSELVRRLGQIRDEFGETCLHNAGAATGIELSAAIAKIIEILAVCFTILIAFICLLNLYNSVMGRRLARHRELAVLATVGITGGQRKRALALECAGLLLKSFAFSTGITAIFVVSLRWFLEERFGKMTFTLPLWMILTAAVVGAVSLFLFTAMSYRVKKDAELIEEVRAEAV